MLRLYKGKSRLLLNMFAFLYLTLIAVAVPILLIYKSDQTLQLQVAIFFVDIPVAIVGIIGLYLTIKSGIYIKNMLEFDRVMDREGYLEAIYDLYRQSTVYDIICTCTSTWPIDQNRRGILSNMRASSISFLGPIRPGYSFLGVLWRVGISMSRKQLPKFRFFHRDQPGVKFVVVGDNVVLSSSVDETKTRGGLRFSNAPKHAELFLNGFLYLREYAIPFDDYLYNTMVRAFEGTDERTLALEVFLNRMTNGIEVPGFTIDEQYRVLREYIISFLPRGSLRYEEKPDGRVDVVLVGIPGPEHPQSVIPALRIVATQNCNFACSYCPEYNENFPECGKAMSFEHISRFIETARNVGFSSFRFTGGEPLMLGNLLLKCLHETGLANSDCSIYIATNGSNLLDYTDQLIGIKNLTLKVSLDTLDPERFKRITRADEKVLGQITEALRIIDNHVRVGVNTVVTRMNQNDIDNIIEYCEGRGFYLKLMDLNWYYDLANGYWDSNFVPLGQISERLEKRYPRSEIVKTIGGYGIPMKQFYVSDKTWIRVKDSSVGSTYSAFCSGCRFFPCQEGIYQLSLTVDGKLKVCRHDPLRTSIDISESLQKSDEVGVKRALETQIEKFFKGAFFRERNVPYQKPKHYEY